MLLQCIGGQPWTTWHWRPEEGSRDRNLHLVCDAVRPLNAQHWPGGKLANQWLEMKQCGEWGGGRWLRLYPANKKGASASTILTVEETRTSRTDGVRNMVRCISQTPLSPPRANYTRKCFARERKGQTPTTVNLPPPLPLTTTPTAATLQMSEIEAVYHWTTLKMTHVFHLDSLWGVSETRSRTHW